MGGCIGGLRGDWCSAMINTLLVTCDSDKPRRAATAQSLSTALTGTQQDSAIIGSLKERGRPRGRRVGTSIAQSLADHDGRRREKAAPSEVY